MVKTIISILIKIGIMLVCFIAANLSLAYMFITITGNSPRWRQVAIGFDQTGNAVLGGNVDETLSSRAARSMMRGEKWGCVLCKLLDYVDKDHCRKSIGS